MRSPCFDAVEGAYLRPAVVRVFLGCLCWARRVRAGSQSLKKLFGLLVCPGAASGRQPRGPSVPGVESACWRVGCGRVAGARAGQPARGFCVWWEFAPARRERPREASLGAATGLAMCGLWSNGLFRFEASESPRDYLLGAVPSFTACVGGLAGLVRHKNTHREQADTSLDHQPAAL